VLPQWKLPLSLPVPHGQVKLIHSEGDAANGKASAIQAKIIQMSERKGWLKAADVRDFDEK
jgi:hypothetical protein